MSTPKSPQSAAEIEDAKQRVGEAEFVRQEILADVLGERKYFSQGLADETQPTEPRS